MHITYSTPKCSIESFERINTLFFYFPKINTFKVNIFVLYLRKTQKVEFEIVHLVTN